MKDNTFKFILVISLLLNISLLTTAGYVYYRQGESRTSPDAHVMQKGGYLFEELSLKPEQAQRLKEQAV